ncbi:MAG: NfeD family protein [Ruminococcus sp.]|nr:NfeD family protein [Ruminococcus sp.]
MEQYMPYIWLGLALFLAFVEVSTAQLVSIWFVVGAVVTSICSAFFLHNVVWQIVVFIVVSAVALVVTLPLVRKLKKVNKTSTNSDRNIGKKARVITEIDRNKSTGLVEVDGQRWTARSSDDSVIPKGSTVIVESIEGVKLIVTLCK